MSIVPSDKPVLIPKRAFPERAWKLVFKFLPPALPTNRVHRISECHNLWELYRRSVLTGAEAYRNGHFPIFARFELTYPRCIRCGVVKSENKYHWCRKCSSEFNRYRQARKLTLDDTRFDARGKFKGDADGYTRKYNKEVLATGEQRFRYGDNRPAKRAVDKCREIVDAAPKHVLFEDGAAVAPYHYATQAERRIKPANQ